MPIRVACKCGQQFAAKDELAGKLAKCPKCGQALQIPQPPKTAAPAKQTAAAPRAAAPAAARTPPVSSSLATLLDEVGIAAVAEDNRPRCPNCKEPMQPEAVLCVSCGFHVESGKQIKGVATALAAEKDTYGLAGEEGHAAAALRALKSAERMIRDDAAEEYKIRTQGMPTWALVLAFAGVVSFCVTMSVLPTGQALAISGWVLIVGAALVSLVCNVFLIVAAFTESLACGLMFLFVPFYSLIYVFTRWKTCKKFFIIILLCQLPSGLGGFLLGLSGNFQEESGKSWRSGEPAAVVACREQPRTETPPCPTAPCCPATHFAPFPRDPGGRNGKGRCG